MADIKYLYFLPLPRFFFYMGSMYSELNGDFVLIQMSDDGSREPLVSLPLHIFLYFPILAHAHGPSGPVCRLFDPVPCPLKLRAPDTLLSHVRHV